MNAPKGKNDHGLDARYFHEKLSQLVRDIDHYTPAELKRALSRLADTAENTRAEPTEAMISNVATKLREYGMKDEGCFIVDEFAADLLINAMESSDG